CRNPSTQRFQFLRRAIELGLRSAAYRDIGAERGKSLGDAEIDAAAAAGDEHRLALVEPGGKETQCVHTRPLSGVAIYLAGTRSAKNAGPREDDASSVAFRGDAARQASHHHGGKRRDRYLSRIG